jgi:hypothetical protein
MAVPTHKPPSALVEIDGEMLARLRLEAARRQTTAPRLARDLLDVAITDNLFRAILDTE